jgi:hypothetical protein
MPAPWTERTVGVELEFLMSTRALGATPSRTISERMIRDALRVLDANRVASRAASYYHSDGRTWDVKTDASCGWEVASPAMLLDAGGYNEELRLVTKALRDMGAQTNASTGLHVHVDASDLTQDAFQRLLILWTRYEPFWYQLVPESRRDNHYCQPLRRSTYRDTERHEWTGGMSGWLALSPDRMIRTMRTRGFGRMGLNFAGWWRHGRVEFRLGGGTLIYDKIHRWAQLLTMLVWRAKTDQLPPVTFSTVDARVPVTARQMARVLGLRPSAGYTPPEGSAELVAWMESRFRRLNPGVAPMDLRSLSELLATVMEQASRQTANGSLDPVEVALSEALRLRVVPIRSANGGSVPGFAWEAQ